MEGETVFSKIINREIPADIVYETDTVVAFRDINPQAPVHILIVPKKIIPDIASVSDEDAGLLGSLLTAARTIAEQEGINDSGFRLIINNGADAGQEISHVHVHLLGGRRLGPMLTSV